MTEETGRRGTVRREIGSECVLTAGWGSEWWREGKSEGRRGETGVIVADGTERASVLRPYCLLSGGRRRQHPLKWPGYDTKDGRSVTFTVSRVSAALAVSVFQCCGGQCFPCLPICQDGSLG